MKKKSLGINAVINGIKTTLAVIFPLITYPYISSILHVENLGKYSYSHSIIDYFCLLSALGIATYAIREGAKYRDSREKISKFASEVFTINIISTALAYFLLGALLIFSKELKDYRAIILVLSISMAFTTVGCEWVYTIYEEYLYIAIRAIAAQLLSLILMFTLVKTEEDVIKYAVAVVISSSGANIANAIGLRKFCTIKPRFCKETFVHLSPILILFANSIATKIYVSADITILGILKGDYSVGIYTVASKIYSVAKHVLSAVIIVSIPRLSLLWGQNKIDKFKETAIRIVYALATLVVPATIGLACLSKEAVLIISTKEFITARLPLCILSVALIASLFNWFYTSCILIPCQREKKVLLATSISAIVNIALNFILIPFWGESAAALTTLLAEAISLAICMSNSRDIIRVDFKKRDILSIFLGCIYIASVCTIVHNVISGVWLSAVLAITISVAGYFAILLLLKNSSAMLLKRILIKKLKK